MKITNKKVLNIIAIVSIMFFLCTASIIHNTFLMGYVIWNMAGLTLMLRNYNNNNIISENFMYKYNFHNWFYTTYEKETNTIYNTYYPIIRITSICCWIIYICYHIVYYLVNIFKKKEIIL